MGDCRIVISLIGKIRLSVEKDRVVLVLSADSTLGDLIQAMESSLFQQTNNNKNKKESDCGCLTFYDDDDDNAEKKKKKGCIRVMLYDVILYPPRSLKQEVKDYRELKGPKSITLQSLGWFPSAQLALILQSNDDDEELLFSSFQQQQQHDIDYQYNRPTADTSSSSSGKTTSTTIDSILTDKYMPQITNNNNNNGGTTLLPSHLLQAVNQVRDAEMDQLTQSINNNNNHHHHHPPTMKRRTEQQRCQRLDAILQNLQNKKNSKTSQQVQQMLIKSRAEGPAKTIHPQDRFYLQIIILNDTHNNNNDNNNTPPSFYYVFSRLTPVGKVASTVLQDKQQQHTNNNTDPNNTSVECLVSLPSSDNSYYRIPSTMPLYQAETNGYCSNFDSLIIRIFDKHTDSMTTTSVLEYTHTTTTTTHTHILPINDSHNTTIQTENLPSLINQTTSNSNNNENKPIRGIHDTTTTTTNLEESGSITSTAEEVQSILANMKQAIQIYQQDNAKSSKKKKISPKVQQMLMKSKATGNKKIKMEDRFFLQVYILQDNNNDNNNNNNNNHQLEQKSTMMDTKCEIMFFSKWSRLQDIANDSILQHNNQHCSNADILINASINNDKEQVKEYMFRRPSPTLRLMDLEKNNHVASFGNLYVRLYTDGMLSIPIDNEM